MTTYVMLANWTDQGIQKVKDSPRRLDTAKKALKEMGGEFMTFKALRHISVIVNPNRAPEWAPAVGTESTLA